VVLYQAFFVSLWSVSDWRKGPAIILFSFAVLILGVLYVLLVKTSHPALLDKEVHMFDEPAASNA